MNNVDASGHVGSRWCSCPCSPIASTVPLKRFKSPAPPGLSGVYSRNRRPADKNRRAAPPYPKSDVSPPASLCGSLCGPDYQSRKHGAGTGLAQKKLRVKYGDGRRSVLQLVPAALQSCARWCRHPAVLAPVQSGIQLHGRKISLALRILEELRFFYALNHTETA